jgi:hypothetical protein
MTFLQNKYTNTYFKIIQRSQNRVLNCYTESHHIIPRSLGGCDEAHNLIRLTAREHFICHRLLPKMTEGLNKMKMCQAAWMMARTRKIRISSRTYALLREEASKVASLRQKGKKVGPMSEEHKQKIREATIRRYQDPAERLKTSLAGKGRKASAETRAKLSASRKGKMPPHIPSMKGKQHSPETKAKMRAAWERRRALSS